ncbi:uncharacterized protein DNG_05584 [Cephalotrichum gorgonifer]|uniref:Uncharacterized protein n=1 Tax=Cephalotrichum gorgonifer TaxID=2041049 RepID=A0AAE8MY54_9PEZI|nr:uncharacterized protein DNG_05584 [Cephalotrichum gorgonifer]
MPYSGEGPER